LPALCAAGIHAGLFLFDPGWRRPEFSVTETRAVTLSLAEVRRAPDPQEPVAPLPPTRAKPIQPLTALRPAPAPQPAPAPLPTPAVEPERLDQEQPSTDAGVRNESAQAPQSQVRPDRGDSGPQQAEVQASVPLYALNPPPAYPPLARRRNYQGTVMLDVLVDRQGRATQVNVARSSGHTLLDQSALESVRRWRFEPARRFGQPVEMWVQVPVRFALE
jgi:periplasmic protein TonB